MINMDFQKKVLLTKKIFNDLGYSKNPIILGSCEEEYNYRNKTIHTLDSKFIDNKIIDLQHIEIINFINSLTWITGFKIIDIFIKHNYLNQFQICFTIDYNEETNSFKFIEGQLKKIINCLGKYEIVSVYYLKYFKDKNIKTNKYNFLLGNKKLNEQINILGKNYLIQLSPYSFSRINYLNSLLIYSIVKKSVDLWEGNILLYGRDIYFPMKLCKGLKVIGGITHCPITFNDIEYTNMVLIEKKNYILGIEKMIENYNNILINITAGRNGLGNSICNYFIQEPKIKKIIYISCNRNSLGKDFKILLEKFRIEKYFVSNEFSHTNYNNIICILKK